MRFLLLLCLVAPAFCAEQRIVGGAAVPIGSYPHMLSLRVSDTHSCGASLISTTRAVTAAQCCGSSIGVYTLLGGTSDRTTDVCTNCRLFTLFNINIHPSYDENGIGIPNDVAVLSFTEQAFNTDFQAINLAQGSADFAGDRCAVTGWGLQQQGGAPPLLLQGTDMTVMANTACSGEWGAALINDGHICVTDPNSGTCGMDTGGPLECSGLLAGARSWAHVSCSPSFPSVYTRISYFYDWIIVQ